MNNPAFVRLPSGRRVNLAQITRLWDREGYLEVEFAGGGMTTYSEYHDGWGDAQAIRAWLAQHGTDLSLASHESPRQDAQNAPGAAPAHSPDTDGPASEPTPCAPASAAYGAAAIADALAGVSQSVTALIAQHEADALAAARRLAALREAIVVLDAECEARNATIADLRERLTSRDHELEARATIIADRNERLVAATARLSLADALAQAAAKYLRWSVAGPGLFELEAELHRAVLAYDPTLHGRAHFGADYVERTMGLAPTETEVAP